MNVYLDTSVVLRVLLGQPDALPMWGKWEKAYSSRLWRVEALRTIERLRLTGALVDAESGKLRQAVERVHATLHLVAIAEDVLQRTEEGFPVVVGTLDGIHLATALLLRRTVPIRHFLTHDSQLGEAARVLGFDVLGVPPQAPPN